MDFTSNMVARSPSSVRSPVTNTKSIPGVVLICSTERFKSSAGFGLLGLRCMSVSCAKRKEPVACACTAAGNRKNKMITNIESLLFIDDDFICYYYTFQFLVSGTVAALMRVCTLYVQLLHLCYHCSKKASMAFINCSLSSEVRTDSNGNPNIQVL